MRALFVGIVTIFLFVRNETWAVGAEGADFEIVSKLAFQSEVVGEKDKLCFMANSGASLSGHGFELKSARYRAEIEKNCDELERILKSLMGTASAFPLPAGARARLENALNQGQGLSERYGAIGERARNVYYEGMASEALGFLRQASLILRKLKIELASDLRKQEERRTQFQKVYESFYKDLDTVAANLNASDGDLTYDLEAIGEDFEANRKIFEGWLTPKDLKDLDQMWGRVQMLASKGKKGPHPGLSEERTPEKRETRQPAYAPSPKGKCYADCDAEGVEGSATWQMCRSICDNLY